MAELDACRVAAVLAADADVELRIGFLAEADSHLHELAYADLVEFSERIVLEDLRVVVSAEELARVVAAEAVSHLREVVRTEAEEIGVLRDFVGGESRSRDLDHRADLVFELGACRLDLGVGGLDDEILDVLELFDFADERDHDLGTDGPVGMILLDVDGGTDDRGGLHLRDLGVRDGEAASSVTHHRVELVQSGDDVLDLLDGLALSRGEELDIGFLGGNELMERRIEESDADGGPFERFVELLEVGLLHREDLRESRFSLLDGVGADHLAERGDPVGIEEHMLGAAEADTLGAQLAGLLRVGGSVGVRSDLQSSELVGPAHDSAEVAADGSGNGSDDTVVDIAGGAVDGDKVALAERLARELELLVLLVHLDVAASGDAALAHTAGDDRRVRGHTAADGEDTLGRLHTGDVLRGGLESDEDDLFAARFPRLGVVRREYDLTAGGSGGSAETAAHRGRRFERLRVELRVKERVEVSGVDHEDRFFLGLHTLVDEVAGDLKSGGSRSLTVAALEHIELAVLDGELHILHIVVMLFKDVADLDEIGISLRELIRHLGDRHRGADAGDDVFALRVHEELAHELLLAGRGVAGEGDAGAGVVVQVAEDHRHDVDGGAPAVGDVVVTAIDVRARVVPRTEHGADSFVKLDLRVGREIVADLRLVLGLELAGELLEVGGGEVDVELDALLRLHLVDELLKIFLADFHNDVGEHLDESSV